MCHRTVIVRTLGIAFVSLLLCAILASELPELLSLTDNTANDFTMLSKDSLVLSVLDCAINVPKPAIKFNISTQDSLFGRLGSPEKTELAPSHLFILYSDLRT